MADLGWSSYIRGQEDAHWGACFENAANYGFSVEQASECDEAKPLCRTCPFATRERWVGEDALQQARLGQGKGPGFEDYLLKPTIREHGTDFLVLIKQEATHWSGKRYADCWEYILNNGTEPIAQRLIKKAPYRGKPCQNDQ